VEPGCEELGERVDEAHLRTAAREQVLGDRGRAYAPVRLSGRHHSCRALRLITGEEQVDLRVSQYALAIPPAILCEDAVGALEQDFNDGAIFRRHAPDVPHQVA
jgi:hypothetical protein